MRVIIELHKEIGVAWDWLFRISDIPGAISAVETYVKGMSCEQLVKRSFDGEKYTNRQAHVSFFDTMCDVS